MNGMDRRREPRLPFRADCTIELTGGRVAVEQGPLRAKTVNITEHGLMVAIPTAERTLYEKVEGTVSRGGIIPARVNLTPRPGFPTLRGQVVWANWASMQDVGPVCQLGLVFQLLSPSENEALQEVLSGLSTHTDLED